MKRNAIKAGVIACIREGIHMAHATPDVRAIVLRAAGDKAYCAGGDLQPGQSFTLISRGPTPITQTLLHDGRNATLPIVARTNSVCMAGGMGLLCMADFGIAADHALFGLLEVKVGLFPMQELSLLQSQVPSRVVREWALTGEPFSAEEAWVHGLANHVVLAEQLDAKTQWLLDRLLDKSPTAIRRGKYAMRAMPQMTFDQAIAYTEGQIALMPMTEDAREGMAAFNEKRRPAWNGR